MDTANLYELTDLGRSLEEPLAELGRWVDANWHQVEAAQRSWAGRAEELIERRLTVELLTGTSKCLSFR